MSFLKALWAVLWLVLELVWVTFRALPGLIRAVRVLRWREDFYQKREAQRLDRLRNPSRYRDE